ncbi:MAG: O-antigen ligase family protein [Flavobacteriaceae bacterium]
MLYFTIPFDGYLRAIPNIILIVLGVLFPFVVERRHFAKFRKTPSLLWLVFFMLITAQMLIWQRTADDWGIIQKVLLSGLLALLFIPLEKVEKINKAIIFSSLAAIVFSCVKLVILVNQGVTFSFLETGSLIEALLIDRVYLGLLCVLSILVSYSSLTKAYHPDNKYYLLNMAINVLFILLMVSRIAILVLVVVFLLSLLYKNKRGPQLLFAIGTLLLAVLFIFIVNNDLRKQLFYSNNHEHKEGLVANTLALEPRAVIWDCAFQLIEGDDSAWKGMGFANTNRKMMECYENSITNPTKKAWFMQQKYNVHNQFLDIYIASGVVILICFLMTFLVMLLKNRKQFYPTALLLTFIMFLFVENMFHRQIGAYYMGFLLLSILVNLDSTKNQGTIEAP